MSIAIQAAPPAQVSRSILRSIGVVAGALIAMAALTLLVDQVLHWLGVFPPWGQVTYEPVPYALAISYRTLFGVGAGWIVARLAPHAAMAHVVALGLVGTVLSIGGLVASLSGELGPLWYPIMLVVVAFPSAWVGGLIRQRGRARRS